MARSRGRFEAGVPYASTDADAEAEFALRLGGVSSAALADVL
ncbi:hypothetical protein [Azohydromonas aeria]|nr:hypothetical protein [Azohydromonas aeria]